MPRLSFSSTDSSEGRLRRRNRLWIGLGFGLVCAVILAACLAIYLPRRRNDDRESACSAVRQDAQRFDCHPDRPISREACLRRGCCFVPASDGDVTDGDLLQSSYLGVPSCFFPPDYRGYRVSRSQTDGNEIRAELERVSGSGFEEDERRVVLEVIPLDGDRLRVQIRDAASARHRPEVPVLDLPERKEEREEEEYNATLSEDGTLEVLRKSTRQTLFRAELSRLVFSDQFLQVSTGIPSEFIYGLGEQKGGVLKSTNWTRYTLFNQGDLPVPHRNLYGSHPFYMVMEHDGLSSGLFLLNSNAIDYVLQVTPAVTIRTIGGIFDLFLLLGPSPGDVVSQYAALFGRPNFPPRWSLGFHICKYGYHSLNYTKEVLNRNLEVGIPVEVQWHDIDFMERHLDFTYDPDNFKGLPEFVDKELHQQNRHYVAMFSPGVSNTEPPGKYKAYDEGKELDLFVKDTEGKDIEAEVWNTNYTVFPDFSNPLTEDYWERRFVEYHSQLHFDGAWIDMNEPLNFLNGSSEGCPDTKWDAPPYLPGRPYPLNTLTLCMSARHNRTVHYNEHNLVAYREAKATHRALSRMSGKRPFIISRASFAGQGVYSGHWSGDITSDWDDMRYTIPAMLSFSLYGMPMTGSDICGFRLNTTEELCARWQALGAFYPFSRNHNDDDTVEQDPAAMGELVINSTKKALRTRYYLLPYLYTLFYRNHAFGETVARPLFFEFPTDKATYTIEDEFLWGPALLIMPALDPGVSTIRPYIPEGPWYDFGTGKLRKTGAGTRVPLEAGLTDINLAVRGGHILPAQEPKATVEESAQSPFDLLVALDGDGQARGELFLDDGESLDTYENGTYNLIQMTVRENTLNVTAVETGGPGRMDLGVIRVDGIVQMVSNVTINGYTSDFSLVEHRLTIKPLPGTAFSLLSNITVEWT